MSFVSGPAVRGSGVAGSSAPSTITVSPGLSTPTTKINAQQTAGDGHGHPRRDPAVPR